jgi:hypothetical protein
VVRIVRGDLVAGSGSGFAPAARLARVGGRNVLFSRSQRAIFSLNDTAADIWASIEEGETPASISRAIAERGIAASVAGGYVEGILCEWERLGVILPAAPEIIDDSKETVRESLAIGGLGVRIDLPPACRQAAAIFAHLRAPDTRAGPDLRIRVVERSARLHLLRQGQWAGACTAAELPTVLKGELLGAVLERARYEIALHAAALVSHGRVLLLGGDPGAGKTTLTISLMRAGLGFAGDDVALIDGDGRCLGLPFAPAVKAGSWPLLSTIWPAVASAPTFRRPDRRRVRYPVPERPFVGVPLPVGWLVLLDRRRDREPARLEPIDAVDALQGLLRGAFATGGELTDTAFDVLAGIVADAGAFTLGYSDLPEAVGLLCDLCDGGRQTTA